MTILLWIVGLIAAAAVLKLLIIWAQPYLAFAPRRGATPPPNGFRAFSVECDDGVRLAGWHTPMPAEGPVVIYFCGNAGNLGDRADLLVQAARHGLNLVAFNYRGAGESEGSATEAGVYLDAQSIYRYVTDSLRVTPERILFWGHSIGGAVGAQLATTAPCAGLVLEATFRSGQAMGKRMFPFLPVGWLMTYKFDNEVIVTRLTCPLLFIHGVDDLTIPPADSELLFQRAVAEKDLWLVPGADHNDVYAVAGDQFFQRLLQFAQQVSRSSAPTAVPTP